jgi:hypothetical protein
LNPPRCPVCKAILSADRAIDERWFPEEKGDAHWLYRYACRGCVSVIGFEIAETRGPRPASGHTRVDIAAAQVTRALEQLSRAADIGELAAQVDAIRADPERRILLRVPELFAVARPAWGSRVRAAEPLLGTMLGPRLLGAGAKVSLRPLDPGERNRRQKPGPIRVATLEDDGPMHLFIDLEDRFPVVGLDGSRLLLGAGPVAARYEMPWIEVLVAWADLVVRADAIP